MQHANIYYILHVYFDVFQLSVSSPSVERHKILGMPNQKCKKVLWSGIEVRYRYLISKWMWIISDGVERREDNKGSNKNNAHKHRALSSQ